jgi:hypothetical protein
MPGEGAGDDQENRRAHQAEEEPVVDGDLPVDLSSAGLEDEDDRPGAVGGERQRRARTPAPAGTWRARTRTTPPSRPPPAAAAGRRDKLNKRARCLRAQQRTNHDEAHGEDGEHPRLDKGRLQYLHRPRAHRPPPPPLLPGEDEERSLLLISNRLAIENKRNSDD